MFSLRSGAIWHALCTIARSSAQFFFEAYNLSPISILSQNSGSARSSTRFFNHFEAMYFSHCDGILTASSWGKIERTLSDLIAYPGIQQWWEERRHWHTEEFGRVVDEIIARGDKPKAFSAFNLREIVGPKAGT